MTRLRQILRDRLGDPTDSVTALLIDGQSILLDDLDDDLAVALETADLARREADCLVPLAQIDVWQDLLVAHDLDQPADIRRDTVLGVNNTTRALAALTPRTQVRRALDVATGPGGLALLLARHSDEVVATDLSEQACGYARLNGILNSTALDVRAGDLYDPVAADPPFDLITGNLPFVVSPETAFTFRDGGRGRDLMSSEAVIGAADHLAPGGTALLMCNWVVPRGSETGEHSPPWARSLDCSVVVLHHSTEAPHDYAARWNRFLLSQDPQAYASAVAKWVDAFESWDVDGIANGTIILHRTEAPARFQQTLQMLAAPSGTGGSQVSRILTNGTWLANNDSDGRLLASRPALVSPHRLEQTMHYDGSWVASRASMVLTDSAGVIGEVDPLATHVLLRLDGNSTVAELIKVATEATDIDYPSLSKATISSLRELIAAGCLNIESAEQ